MDADKRPLPVEDIQFRDPEWEELVRTPGAGPSEGRTVYWDHVHGWVYMTAPKIQVTRSGQTRFLRPY